MAKFLNTSGTTYHLEELIKSAKERLILISPYLKFNERIKELLEDKNRLKIDVRVVYGKNDLQPAEINWLKNLDYIRTSYCKNLHAKCYLNERSCIITSLNLYEFSQVNNNEMGILVERDHDESLYADAYDEAQRIIRISDELRVSAEVITEAKTLSANQDVVKPQYHSPSSISSESTTPSTNVPQKPFEYEKLTTAKLAEKMGIKTAELNEKLVQLGYVNQQGKEFLLTEQGRQAGGEIKKGKFGDFVVWSVKMDLSTQPTPEDQKELPLMDKLRRFFS